MKSHTVHCPHFPNDKQEYWWLYVADRKKHDLITVPVRITNLVDKLDIDVQFAAPQKPGSYIYTMCLKSDSYVDMDLYQTLKVCLPLEAFFLASTCSITWNKRIIIALCQIINIGYTRACS